jgi:hypothetical protein
MASGEWRSIIGGPVRGSGSPGLKRADQGAQHLSERLALRENRFGLRRLGDLDLFCQQKMSLQFFQRTLRDTQKLNERTRVFPTMPFRDIGGD